MHARECNGKGAFKNAVANAAPKEKHGPTCHQNHIAKTDGGFALAFSSLEDSFGMTTKKHVVSSKAADACSSFS